jgi:hypothetical protein
VKQQQQGHVVKQQRPRERARAHRVDATRNAVCCSSLSAHVLCLSFIQCSRSSSSIERRRRGKSSRRQSCLPAAGYERARQRNEGRKYETFCCALMELSPPPSSSSTSGRERKEGKKEWQSSKRLVLILFKWGACWDSLRHVLEKTNVRDACRHFQ